MTRATSQLRRRPHSLSTFNYSLSTRARPGFTFVEVLFAIVILGIGAIMLAGMLPVAIKQTDDTRNEIAGRAIAEGGYAYLRTFQSLSAYGLPYTSAGGATPLTVTGMVTTPPGTPRVVPLTSAVIAGNATPTTLEDFASVTGSRISSTDPRFQWLAFYGRQEGATSAKLVVLALHLSNTDPTPAYNGATLNNADNGPHLLAAEIVDGGPLDPDRVTLTGSLPVLDAADAGAFIIVANQGTGGAADAIGNVGRVFRLGARRFDLESSPTTARIFDLQAGYDLPARLPGTDGKFNTADDVADLTMATATEGTQVWLVGRGLKDPTAAASAANPYVGPVQDVAVLQVTVPPR